MHVSTTCENYVLPQLTAATSARSHVVAQACGNSDTLMCAARAFLQDRIPYAVAGIHIESQQIETLYSRERSVTHI